MKMWVIESPKGEGTPHPALGRVEALWIGESAAEDSPSPCGRAGVRGKNRAPPVDQIHAQRLDSTPHPVPSPFQGERGFTTEVWCILRTP
jgi:hypothetical protein